MAVYSVYPVIWGYDSIWESEREGLISAVVCEIDWMQFSQLSCRFYTVAFPGFMLYGLGFDHAEG